MYVTLGFTSLGQWRILYIGPVVARCSIARRILRLCAALGGLTVLLVKAS